MYATSRRALSALSSAARGTQIYDACIVGGGVVGLAVAREMATRGHSVILVEKEQSVGAGGRICWEFWAGAHRIRRKSGIPRGQIAASQPSDSSGAHGCHRIGRA